MTASRGVAGPSATAIGLTLAGIGLGTALLAALFGVGAVGADGQFALLWGHQLVSGRPVELDAPYAPTPHPLTIALGGLVALAGGAGPGLMSVVGLAALSTMGAALWWLTDELFGRRAAWVSCALLAMSPWFVVSAATGPQDSIYVALLIVACRMEVRRSRAGTPVLAMLALAGLVRPEAWGLSAIYCLHLWTGPGERRRSHVVLAAASPALWLLMTWAVTGDPFASLHATRELRELIGRETGLLAGASAIPALVREVTGAVIPVAGLVGAVLGLGSGDRRLRRLLVALVILAALYLLQSAAGFSVIQRYLLAVDAGLLVLAAGVLAGHRSLGVRARPIVALAPLLLWLGIALTLGDRHVAYSQARGVTAALASSWRELGAVLPAAASACGPVNYGGPADWRPIVALHTGLALRDVRLSSVRLPVSGIHLVPVDADLRALARQPAYAGRAPERPAGAQVLARTHVWELSTTCRGGG